MRPDQEEFFTVLYREYFNQIKLYAMAHISDPHRAEEIAQDTFHTAVEKIDTLMKADEPIRWLKRTAKNKIRSTVFEAVSLSGCPGNTSSILRRLCRRCDNRARGQAATSVRGRNDPTDTYTNGNNHAEADSHRARLLF